ncbi:MAG: pyruvate kinase [Magnetovibrionaceae bacterium]
MSKDILCTLGPASLNEHVISRLEDLGVTLFRVNLSHTRLADVEPTIRRIREFTDMPVCLDSEGAQIRTGTLVHGGVDLLHHSLVFAPRKRVPGSSYAFNFWPLDIVDRFEVGDFISIDFNSVLVQVSEKTPEGAWLRVITGGRIGSNKAVTVNRRIELPPLTEDDQGAFRIGASFGLKHFALSFANRPEDVDFVRGIIGPDATLISKIESLSGLEHLEGIASRSEAILIDRGDLSREVALESIPAVQKQIIKRGKASGTKVYVATNLLESMVREPQPTRAELNDIYNTLCDGADGLVLAAETAIGAYPVRCASMVVKMIDKFERRGEAKGLPQAFDSEMISLLVPPHGGRLVNRIATPDQVRDAGDLPRLCVPESVVLDCHHIGKGTFSPLEGFMDKSTIQSVLQDHRLPDGTAWTMPILLQVPGEEADRFGPGDTVVLSGPDARDVALLEIKAKETLDLDAVAQDWFRTTSTDHPGVRRLKAGGEQVLSGAVTLLEEVGPDHQTLSLSPTETRYIFSHKGWQRVVAFHGRNPPHRAHEFIQMTALEQTRADGLFINPLAGPKKAGDFLAKHVIESYRVLTEFECYPSERIVLASFSTYPRYCGGREAVFTALCRKNMGCSHFIVGRDHAGVGGYYPPDDARRAFDAAGDLEIEPVFFDAIGFNPDTQSYEIEQPGQNYLSISGTEARKTLLSGERLPSWFMRDLVQDLILDEVAQGHPVIYPDE